jgi:SAM-dependent methyltransferase
VTVQELKASFADFSAFARSLKGDEKSEAQLFLDHFFRALGHAGVQEAGATFEFRIAKKPGSAQLELIKGEDSKPRLGGKKFADLLWPGRVLIEMKQRGYPLEKAYDQLFEYWQLIVPNRPAFAILCNFDAFWIYDFNTQLFDPVDRVPVAKLAENLSPFNFLLPTPKKPIFDNNRVEVTRKAADRMAQLFRDIVFRGEDRARTQRFILQLLVAMVAEDINLLPGDIVTELLGECAERGGSSYDLLGGLFRQMATDEPARGGRYQGVRYFNGGLFAVVEPIELKRPEAYALHDAARDNDWSKVKPEIFGTLFQQSMDTGEDGKRRDERHAFGAHFTSEFDIQKVVGPTIVRPWRERIEAAGKNLGKLRETLRDLRLFRVLDPACGSGNFLFVAYREIKRLERTLLLALRDAGENPDRLASGILLTNFFGIDILPFAVELAKVTLMLAKELELREADKFEAADGLHLPEKPLPLDNLDQQIVCADSLFTEWPAVDTIIGNPPFVAKNNRQQELGADYVQKLRKAYPEVPGRADYCVYWFRKAHDQLKPWRRAGLVGTNTIRQNYSRHGGLDYILANGGMITEAISTQVWSGDAAVHVSIANWIKGAVDGPKKLITQRGELLSSPWDVFEMPFISSALSPGLDVSSAVRLEANASAEACFQGQTHGHHGFMLTPGEAAALVRKDPRSAEVLFPYLTGDELVGVFGAQPSRYVIDFHPRNVIDASSYREAYARIRATALPGREAAAESERKRNESVFAANPQAKVNRHHANFLKRWWLMSYAREDLMAIIRSLPRYIACARVTKRPIFEFIAPTINPSDVVQVFPFSDDYGFGILQSGHHWLWFNARCSTLGGTFRYTSDTVFDTFPWPQTPTKEQIAEVAAAAVALRALRREIMAKLCYSLRDLYRTLEDPGTNPLRDAHTRLDTAVSAAYAMPKDSDPLAFLLALNVTLASKEKAGEKITAPGLPVPENDRAAFITDDCVRVSEPTLCAGKELRQPEMLADPTHSS